MSDPSDPEAPASPSDWPLYAQSTSQMPQTPAPSRSGGVSTGIWRVIVGVMGVLLIVCLVVAGSLLIARQSYEQCYCGNLDPGEYQTPLPTATATATAVPASTKQAIANIAKSLLGGSGTTISVTFSIRTGYAAIKDTLAGSTFDPVARAQIIKNDTFALMALLFTSGLPIVEVYYRVDGPLVNSVNGQPSIGPYAEVVLTAATAKRLNWGNLSPEQAWGDYDSAFVRTH